MLTLGAIEGLGRVEVCTHCNCVSVHLGALTMRLEPDGLHGAAELLTRAAMALREYEKEYSVANLGDAIAQHKPHTAH